MESINITFPIIDDPEKSNFLGMNVVTKKALSSNLLLLLLTEKGERYYNPDYGTNLRKFIFEPNDSQTESEIERDIKETVGKYLPQLTIKNVEFYSKGVDEEGLTMDDNEIRVVVDFLYSEDAFSEPGTLELTFN